MIIGNFAPNIKSYFYQSLADFADNRRISIPIYCSESDRSGIKQRISVAITGNTIPIQNQSHGLLPNRLARRDVISGTDKKRSNPKNTINSPICILFYFYPFG